MLTIREIPKRDLNNLGMLSGLDQDSFDRMVRSFQAAGPHLSMRKFIQEATASLPDKVRDTAKLTAETVLSMQFGRARMGASADEFVAAVFAAENIGELKLAPEKLEAGRGRLQHLLAIDSLFITAKAASVLTAHEHAFESARIFTDIRPIFGEPAAGANRVEPRAAVLVHNLKLRLAGAETERELYVAMDNHDLQTLIDALNRARAKAAELSAFVKRGGLSYLEP